MLNVSVPEPSGGIATCLPRVHSHCKNLWVSLFKLYQFLKNSQIGQSKVALDQSQFQQDAEKDGCGVVGVVTLREECTEREFRISRILGFFVVLNAIQYKFKYNQMEDSQECIDQQEIAGFISKTYEILGNNQFAKIVFWSPLGDQFIIKDHNKFEQVVLPRYFRHNKMNSFIRQLNMYGFHKSRKDNSRSVFSHPSFLKEREDLLITIKRRLKCTSRTTYEQTPVKPVEAERSKNTPTTGLDLRSASHLSKEDLFGVKLAPSNLELAYSSMDLNQSYNKLPMGSIGKMTYPSAMDLNIDEEASIEHIMPTLSNERKEGVTCISASYFFLTSVRVNRE